jgi:hypothetical protein
VSYLITGQPDFAGESQEYRSLVTSVLAPSVSSVLTNSLRGRLGGGVDLRLEGANPDFAAAPAGTQGTLSSLGQFLYSSRLNGDVQFTDKLFFNLSAGFCQLQLGSAYAKSVQQSGLLSQLSEPFGGNLQYRLTSQVKTGSNLQMAVEPPTQALLCSTPGETNLRGTAPTPRQFSLSFLKYWRW